MILFYKNYDYTGNYIETFLNQESIAHKTLETAQKSYIQENGKNIKGYDNLKKFFNHLKRDLDFQRSISGDACYIDPDTGTMC